MIENIVEIIENSEIASTQMVWEELSDGENKPEPAGNTGADVGWHFIAKLVDVRVKERLQSGEIGSVLRQTISPVETVAIEVIIVDREEHPLHDETHEAGERDEIWREPFRIQFHNLIPERMHYITRQWWVVHTAVLFDLTHKHFILAFYADFYFSESLQKAIFVFFGHFMDFYI